MLLVRVLTGSSGSVSSQGEVLGPCAQHLARWALFLGDCRFVSATFRLFKVPGSSRAGPGQVIYNGGIVGHERELVFDANFTFKVRGGAFWASGDGEHTQPEGLGMGQH